MMMATFKFSTFKMQFRMPHKKKNSNFETKPNLECESLRKQALQVKKINMVMVTIANY